MPLAIEFALRGGAAGLCLLLGGLWLVEGRSLAARLGAVFVLITCCYVLASSPQSRALFGPLQLPLGIIASFGSVAFWLFARALFRDRFRLRPVDALPAVIIALCLAVKIPRDGGVVDDTAAIVHGVTIYAMLIHVVVLAIRGWRGDLVPGRRAFRLAVATLIPLVSVITTTAEIANRWTVLPKVLIDLHALVLFALSFGFAVWGLRANAALFPAKDGGKPAPPSQPVAVMRPDSLSAPDRIELDKVLDHMERGGYREEGLTVGKLGDSVGVPEHRLRVLINRGLGYRNFAAFLNSYRLREAEKILAAPERARDHILKIALDLGYGSVGPFNRAFKAETGLTPTEFRAERLADFEKNELKPE